MIPINVKTVFLTEYVIYISFRIHEMNRDLIHNGIRALTHRITETKSTKGSSQYQDTTPTKKCFWNWV